MGVTPSIVDNLVAARLVGSRRDRTRRREVRHRAVPALDASAHSRGVLDRTGSGRSIGCVAVDVVTEIVIDRPCPVVARYAGDPSNATHWYANIESVRWRTEPPVRVGSSMDFVARFLGRRLAYTYEVVELVAGERLVMRTAQGPFPMETTYAWEPAGVGLTRMRLRNRGEPAGFGRITAPVIVAAMRRANQKDLVRLKQILEAQCHGPAT